MVVTAAKKHCAVPKEYCRILDTTFTAAEKRNFLDNSGRYPQGSFGLPYPSLK
jgi:hypothetical protein